MSSELCTTAFPDLRKLAHYNKLLPDLLIVYAIVNCKGVGNAARALAMNPTAVTMRVSRLEAFLGVPLLLREHQKCRLTPEGKEFLELASGILPSVLKFAEKTDATRRGNDNKLYLAAIPSIWSSQRQYMKGRFAEAGGEIVEPRADTKHTDDIIELVRNSSVDLGIVTYKAKRRHLGGLSLRAWKREPMVMVVSANVTSIKEKDNKWATAEVFKNFDAVMLDKKYEVRCQTDAYLRQNNLRFREVIAEKDSIDGVIGMVAGSTDLASIVPLPNVDKRLKWSDLPGDSDTLKRPVNFVWRRKCRGIVEHFLECFPDMNTPAKQMDMADDANAILLERDEIESGQSSARQKVATKAK